jgi:Na+(H+)/acetate symporter ActP
LAACSGPPQTWWGIPAESAGVFGVPAGFVAILLGSLFWPDRREPAAVAKLRAPA